MDKEGGEKMNLSYVPFLGAGVSLLFCMEVESKQAVTANFTVILVKNTLFYYLAFMRCNSLLKTDKHL